MWQRVCPSSRRHVTQTHANLALWLQLSHQPHHALQAAAAERTSASHAQSAICASHQGHPTHLPVQSNLLSTPTLLGKQLWPELQTGILRSIKSLAHDIIFNLSSLGLPVSPLETPQHLSPCCQLSCTSPPLCSSSVSVTCQSQCLESLHISFKVLLFCTGAGMGWGMTNDDFYCLSYILSRSIIIFQSCISDCLANIYAS